MPSPARVAALDVLLKLRRNRGSAADAIAEADAGLADPRERAFLRELVLGSLRSRGRIDHALAGLTDRPLERVDPAALEALRLGAYQILDLRVPDRAAVSESVDLARSQAPAAGGFVNAVLRRLGREGAPALPDPVTKPREWLVSAGSLPAWLADRWIERFGAAAAIDRARSLLLPPPVALRLNPRRPEAEARASESGLRLHGLTVPGAYRGEGGDLVGLAAEGLLYVQDEGSQLVARLASEKGRLLDACAAPGGKATALADSRPDVVVAAAEPDSRRRATLARLCARWGAPNLHVVGANALRPPFGRDSFDGVLLDAPCSGLGTLARHPDVRWRTQAADLPRHAALQGRLLRSLADLVRPGGLLVYATCSSEPEENEEIVGAFLKESADFALAPLPAWAAGFAEGPFARSGARDGDSFFAALLRRR